MVDFQGPLPIVYREGASLPLGEHVFPSEKYGELGGLLGRAAADGASLEFHDWIYLDSEDPERVHNPGYLRDLREARESWATLSSELPVNPEVIGATLAMAGASARTVELACERGLAFCVGGGFHHAFPDHAEGFCFFHDMAIAVERRRALEGLGQVLFVDVDVHQGNGSVAIYREDRETLCYSIHQRDNYPPKQSGGIDRALDDGVGDEAYLEVLGADLRMLEERVEPELVCYVAGVDPHVDDQLGGLALSSEGLRRRDALVLQHFSERKVPVAIFLAGGYQRDGVVATARLHLATALEAERILGGRT